jgi:myo-inositol catabolism protein IolS
MEKRKCGDSDLELSVLGLGCWAFGGGKYWGYSDQEAINKMVKSAVDLGINYFDTAEAYNEGNSERSLGEAIQGIPRDKLIIGTKISPSNTNPQVLVEHCEASLKRIKTDYIDLYMVHWPITLKAIAHFTDQKVECPSINDAFATLRRLKEQGKIRYIGISNFAENKLKEVVDTNTEIVVNQLPYNLLCRAIEYDILPECIMHGIGVIGYFALLQGVLADIYPALDDVPAMQRRTRHFDSRKCNDVRHGENGAEEETNECLKQIRIIAQENGLTMPQISLKWAIANREISCTLAGARNIAKLEDNIHSVKEPLTKDVFEKLNKVTDNLKEQIGKSFDYYETASNDRTI